MSILFPTKLSKAKWILDEVLDTGKYIRETTKKVKPNTLGVDISKEFMKRDDVQFTLKALVDKYDAKGSILIKPNLSEKLTITSWSLVSNNKLVITKEDPFAVLQEVGKYVLIPDEKMLAEMKSWLK